MITGHSYYYGDAPEVEVVGATKLEFAYMPAHLHYILFELLKNSMRATLETHETSGELPPITVVVAEGEDEVAMSTVLPSDSKHLRLLVIDL